ncbi:winged helix-turn-helix domain-containing protein [Micromonospora globbae]|uniref:Winged helix-turn-helix domain-containing protein n=1 Tax=Micromonospora globbae TaxID=1894969 RepID=A0ABZ1SHB3_9ACTN|nr:BTAD domain-containing putative transcriptional regulator [Micromonospora globbae]
MRFAVLGPVAVTTDDGTPVRVPGLKVRTLLADLLAHHGTAVSTDRLVADLWGDAAPANPAAALQVRVSQLRRAFEEAEPGGRDLLVSRPPGYLLRVGPGALDAIRFTDLAERAAVTSDPRPRAELLAEALRLWRGEPFADFADEEFVRPVAVRLAEQRLVALEQYVEARLDLGEHAGVVGELADLVARHPLRERLRAAQVRALYRAGRQSEALASYADLRARLAEELGLDPGPELVALHRAILTQDPALTVAAPPAAATVTVATATAHTASAHTENATDRATQGGTAPAEATQTATAPAEATRTETAPAEAAQTATNGEARSDTATNGPGARRLAGNLPVALTDLVGRDEALDDVRAAVSDNRLVTLTGAGGVGKTRLALETARRLGDDFPDGVWLVELAGVARGPEPPLAERIGAVLQIRDDTTGGPPVPLADRLAAALAGRRLLLVLDNCEHVVDAAAELSAHLLSVAPHLRILATSREPLGLSGEVVWEVPPLEVPDPTAATDPGRLGAFGAVRLFVARASAASRGFTLDGGNAAAVALLCRRLDGIPLALELAATRVRALGVQGLVDRLDDRFRLLATGHRGAPPRQRTLTAMIDWSWQLLDDGERTVLRRLAVHVDGYTLAAAEAVCADRELAGEDVFEVLARLVDRSLVRLDDRVDPPRYRLLESVAAYCADRLAEAGETDLVRERHVRWYTEFAEAAATRLHGPAQREWLRRLDAEAANLRAAADTAVRTGSADLALRLADALAWYRFLRGRLGEARRALDDALALPGATAPSLVASARAWRAGLAMLRGDGWPADRAAVLRDLAGVTPPSRRGRAHWFLAMGATDLGEGDVVDELIGQALRDFETAGDTWGVAAALTVRAKLAHVRGDLAGLDEAARCSAELFARLGDAWGQLQAGEWLGALAELTGDYAEAVRRHSEGLRIAEEMGLWSDACGRLCWLGWLALEQGDPSRAREFGERAVRLAGEQGLYGVEVFADLVLGFAARREGRLDLAEERLRPLLRTAGPDGGHALHVSMVLVELGFIAEHRGDAGRARSLHRQALTVAGEQDAVRDQAYALEGLAGAAALDGAYAEAARLLGAAEALRAEAGLPPSATERDEVERIRACVRAALGAEAFVANVTDGRGLSPARAAGLAPSPAG